jgi:hypothetical protein
MTTVYLVCDMKALLIIWLILLLPWILVAALAGMAFDGGPTPQAHLFIWSVWSYPLPVIGACIFYRKQHNVVLLPLINVVGVLLSSL